MLNYVFTIFYLNNACRLFPKKKLLFFLTTCSAQVSLPQLGASVGTHPKTDEILKRPMFSTSGPTACEDQKQGLGSSESIPLCSSLRRRERGATTKGPQLIESAAHGNFTQRREVNLWRKESHFESRVKKVQILSHINGK